MRNLWYIGIPFITATVAYLGSQFTSLGMPWYDTLARSSITPPGFVFGLAWTIIYITATISAILLYRSRPKDRYRRHLLLLFVFNAALNVFWTQLFFGNQMIGAGLIEIVALLLVTTILMIMLWWRQLKLASILLAPYVLWLCLATYLNFVVWRLN